MKTGVRVSKGHEAGCTGPGCPSKDVNFYKVEWGAVSGSMWPVCCWQGQEDQLGTSCDHSDERCDGLDL